MSTRTIWKYPLLTTDRQVVQMPKGAKILTVQTQLWSDGEHPFLWAMVDPNAEHIDTEIRTHGTGHELPGDAVAYEHLGTYQLGALVFHVFRVKSFAELAVRGLFG